MSAYADKQNKKKVKRGIGFASRGAVKKAFYLTGAGFICLVLVSSLAYFRPNFVQRVDRGIYDIYLKSMAGGEPSPVPIIVDIDEKSLRIFGQRPWPRYLLAELLAALYENGAASIGVDILMPEPDRTSPELWAEGLERDFGVRPEIEDLPTSETWEPAS